MALAVCSDVTAILRCVDRPNHGGVGLALAVAAAGLVGCLSAAERRRQDEARQQMLGDRETESPPRRTAAARPKPWVEEKRPLDADRTGVAGQRAREHARPEKEQPAELSLAQCLQLEEIYPCPLLVHRWRARDATGGIALNVAASRREANRLRDALRCLDRYGRRARPDGCLARFLPARITGRYDGETMHLRLVVTEQGRVADLRRRVRELVEEAR